MKRDHGAVGEDIRRLEEELKSHLNRWILAGGGSDSFVALPLAPVPLGEVVLLLVDAGWGALGVDGKVKKSAAAANSEHSGGSYFEIQVPEEVSAAQQPCSLLCCYHCCTHINIPSPSRFGAASSRRWTRPPLRLQAMTATRAALRAHLLPPSPPRPAGLRSGSLYAPPTRCCWSPRADRECSGCPLME